VTTKGDTTVEWVETTGRTVEDATELAIEQLGVDPADAEVEVIEEPRSGLFGRTRGQARVRARVVPKGPRPKQERRRKGGRSEGGGRSGGGSSRGGREAASSSEAAPGGDAETGAAPAEAPAATGAPERSSGRTSAPTPRERPAKERTMMDDAEQVRTVEEFLAGLVTAMGLEAATSGNVDDGIVRAELSGEGLGVLVGPRLVTLDAIQEISRNVLQREAGDREHGKVVLDVAGVRELRREALTRFVEAAADRARAEGTDVVLDVMNGVDRKVVHDTVATLDGVESISEGEDPRRRVVIRPA
jgi:spoIIIJ-associated protein